MKFRVWDKVAKEYLLTSAITSEGDLMLLGQAYGKWREVNPEIRDNYIIEYWTGKQDRNGIDIYDGDIHTSCYDNCCESIVIDGDFFCYDIETKEVENFCVDVEWKHGTHHISNLHKLGNIHNA